MSHTRVELRIDVAAAAGLPEAALVAATLHLPGTVPSITPTRDTPLELLVCYAGGGYDRRYWDAQVAGYPGYSFAEHLVGAGRAVLAIDHLGMGDSSRPQREAWLSRHATVDAAAHVLDQVLDGLRGGRWNVSAARIAITGVGHSMGAMVLLTHADRHRAFDRIVLLGWTNATIALPDVETGAPSATLPEGYHPSPREAMRPLFYAPDVPLDVVTIDEAAGSLTPACLGRDAMTPGIVHAEAARVTCPVMLVLGGIDISPRPRREVDYFAASDDVTLTIAPDAAHCHNFASSRVRIWNRMNRWITSLPIVCSWPQAGRQGIEVPGSATASANGQAAR